MELTFADSFEVLCLQVADEGRGPVLFGESLGRARTLVKPFLVGEEFPDIYLEFPLKGDPFLDVTVLYGQVTTGTRVASDAAGCANNVFDWFSDVRREHPDVSFGFELDTKEEELPPAAVHFQPRHHVELATTFCNLIGEPKRAELYVDTCRRMLPAWQLSFFGLFRGRPDSPLRVCGYLSKNESERCAHDRDALKAVFDQVGFAAYDNTMLEQVGRLMGSAPKGLDFQFDVYPDGTFGDTFAIDAQFQIEQPRAVHDSFSSGVASRVITLFEEWGITDDRWKLAVDATFARSIPIALDDGSVRLLAFTLMPQWTKARWRDGVLQPAKLYCLAKSTYLDKQ